MRRATAVALVLLLAPLAAPAQEPAEAAPEEALQTRAFQVRHKPVEDVVLVVHEILSEQGSIRWEKRVRIITVTDVQSVLDEVAEVIRAIDTPPPMVEVTMTLFLGTRGGDATEDDAEMVFGSIVERLRNALKYTDYQVLGTMQVTAPEGESAMGTFADGAYRVELRVERVDADRQRIVLHPVELSARRVGEDGTVRYDRLLRTHIQVTEGKMGIQGSAPSADSDRALFLSVGATIER
jgi:hypothetical protein